MAERSTRTLLMLCYGVAFVLTPYWIFPETITTKFLLLAALLTIGAFWATKSAGSVAYTSCKGDSALFGFILLLTLGLNYNALWSDIAWRGDEDLHINYTYSLYSHVTAVYDYFPWYLVWLTGMLLAGVLVYGWRKQHFLFYVLVVAVAACFVSAIFVLDEYVDFRYLLRYPYINRWFSAVPVIITGPVGGEYQEITYRVLPLLSVVLLSWIFARKFLVKPPAYAVIAAATVVTLPVIVYYTSILYLEMPAVVLMTYVLFRGDAITSDEYSDLVRRPAWYALIFMGFIKETTAPFILAVVSVRILRRFRILQKRSPDVSEYAKEGMVPLMAAVPLAVYLFARLVFGDVRPYSPQLMHLLDLQNYLIVLGSLWSQFGLLLLATIPAIWLLLFNRRHWSVVLICACFLAQLIFNVLDYSMYHGYARFNLFLLPPFLMFAKILLDQLVEWDPRLYFGVGALLISANLAMMPTYTDGSRVPGWTIAISEDHTFPYRNTIKWLSEHRRHKEVRFAGLDYPYYLEFYFRKFGWEPRYDVQLNRKNADLASIVAETIRGDKQVLVYHGDGHVDLTPYQDMVAHIERNKAHRLVVLDLH